MARLEKTVSPSVANKTTETTNSNKPAADDEDDGVDLFASDSEEESAEAAKVREERLAAYNAKKSKSKKIGEICANFVLTLCFRASPYRQVEHHIGGEAMGR